LITLAPEEGTLIIFGTDEYADSSGMARMNMRIHLSDSYLNSRQCRLSPLVLQQFVAQARRASA
jgi:hypothetical protein